MVYIQVVYNHGILIMMKIIDTLVDGGKIVGSIRCEDAFFKWFETDILAKLDMTMNDIKSILREINQEEILREPEGTCFVIKEDQTYTFIIVEKVIKKGWFGQAINKKYKIIGKWYIIPGAQVEKEYYQVLDFKTATEHTLKAINPEKITMIVNCNNVEILKHFPNITNLHFEDNAIACRWIKANDIPETVETLHLPECYKLQIGRNVLGENIKSITIGSHYGKLNVDMLPPKLESLRFGPWYNHDIKKNIIPNTVTYLYFGKAFNKDLNGILPENLKGLVIESPNYKYNIRRESIPKSLEYIRINGIVYEEGSPDYERLLDKKMFDMTLEEMLALLHVN